MPGVSLGFGDTCANVRSLPDSNLSKEIEINHLAALLILSMLGKRKRKLCLAVAQIRFASRPNPLKLDPRKTADQRRRVSIDLAGGSDDAAMQMRHAASGRCGPACKCGSKCRARAQREYTRTETRSL